MIKLTIKNGDESVRWVENFNDRASADKWIAEEQTRNYWKPEFSFVTEEILPRQPSAQEFADAKAKDDQEKLDDLLRKAAKTRINSSDLSKIKDADIRTILTDIRILLSKWQ